MIIWLASYPRSGNTLLRTIMKQCFNRQSYSDEEPPVAAGLENEVAELIGDIRRTSDWKTFYRDASDSDDLFLIKTHLAPIDDAPAIYVHRDGRSAIESYKRYHSNVHSDAGKSIDDLIYGDDYYGSWSEHYRSWKDRNDTLYLSYQDIYDPNDKTLSLIARHIGISTFSRFQNPLSTLQRKNQTFFGKAQTAWKNSVEFDAERSGVFSLLHGDISVELKYQSPEEVRRSIGNLSDSSIRMVRKIQEILIDLKKSRMDSFQKEEVIQNLISSARK